MDRPEILARLAECFRAYGYEGTSLTRMTEATGLGKGSLYHAFPMGKAQIAAEVLASIAAWFELQIYAPLRDEPPDKALAGMFDNVTAYFRSGRRTCLIGAFAIDDTRDQFARAISDYFTAWIDALTLALGRHGHPPDRAARLAAEIVAGIQGAIVLSRALGDDRVFPDLIGTLRHRALSRADG